jgi:hypothetical protein
MSAITIHRAHAIAAKNPGVAAMRRDHSRAMRAPMIGIPMVGDAWIQDQRFREKERGGYTRTQSDAKALMIRRACQYATALAERQGMLDGPLNNFHAIYCDRSKQVTFIRCDASQAEVGAFTIPAHVLAFNPDAAPIALPAPDSDELEAERCPHTADFLDAAPAPALPSPVACEAAPAIAEPVAPAMPAKARRIAPTARTMAPEWKPFAPARPPMRAIPRWRSANL